jgi:hypothetical protein
MYTSIKNDANGQRGVLFSYNNIWPADEQGWARSIKLEKNQTTLWPDDKQYLRYYTGATAHSADIDRNGGAGNSAIYKITGG